VTPSSGTSIRSRTKVVYALGDHTVNTALSSLSFFYLHFLTDVVGLRPVLAGLVRWIGPLVDAFTDPIMGRLSDRTRWRGGRRRPYFLIGALPFGLSFALLWSEAPFDSELARTLYYAAVYVGFGLCVTVVSVPYLALIPEIAPSYQERTSVNTFRSAGAMLGVGVALSLRPLANHFGGEARDYAAVGALAGLWLALPWLAVYAVSWEVAGFRRAMRGGFLAGLRALLGHRAYRLVASLYLCSRVAVDLVTGLMLYYFQNWLGRPADFNITMGLFLIGLIATLPLWLRISRAVEKRTLFILGASVWVVVQLVFLAATPEWPRGVVFLLGALAGVGYGAVEMMPWSMLGDVVDEDELATGERREGIYAGFFMFLRKLAGPSVILVVGVILDVAGYTGEGAPPESAVTAIRWLAALAPAVFLTLAVGFARAYPLTRSAHAEILAELARRRAAAAC
jgi:sugar (glycoside-pentoside-hexuronide) transporter